MMRAMEEDLKIDFKRDLRNVLSLPWSIILRYGFIFGLLAAIGGAVMGIPEILLEQLSSFLNTGEVELTNERDISFLVVTFLLIVFLVACVVTFLLVVFLLLQGSKTVQFAFLWSLAMFFYGTGILLLASILGTPVVLVVGAFAENEAMLAGLAVVLSYPGWKAGQGLWFMFTNFRTMSRWVYRTVAEL